MLNQNFLLFYLVIILSGQITAQNPFEYEVVDLCDLNLNRTARTLNAAELEEAFPSSFGFIWNDGDNSTRKFRPQGITEINLDCKRFIAVSWYGRADQNYSNRGVRISFADITDPEDIHYRHVILVDENYSTFYDMHGGGIHYLDGVLYVPDTRSTSSRRLYAFNLSNIQRVPDSDLSVFHNYRYVVKRTETYELPIQASCVSYDWDSQEFITATFHNLCDYGCFENPNSTFSWFKKENVGADSPYYSHFFDRIQGIVSRDNNNNSSIKDVWVAQSYGRYNPSFLYASSVPIPTESTIDFSSVAFYPFILPPGLEDLHLTEDQQQIWSLTEFGPQEGTDNDRLVLAFNTADILPPVINSNEELEENFNQVLNLCPNPSNGTLMIDIPNELSGKLSIYNLSGQLVFEKNVTISDRVLKLNLEPGLYLTQLVSKGKKASTKLMVH